MKRPYISNLPILLTIIFAPKHNCLRTKLQLWCAKLSICKQNNQLESHKSYQSLVTSEASDTRFDDTYHLIIIQMRDFRRSLGDYTTQV